MSGAIRTTAARAVDELAVLWLCLSLAGAFFWWTASSALTELQDAPLALARFLMALALASVPALAACMLLNMLRMREYLARIGCTSALCYLGFLKIAGLALAPWVALGLAFAAALLARPKIAVTPMLLMVHVMGTMTGMYLVFSLERYLPGRDALLNALRGLWWMVAP